MLRKDKKQYRIYDNIKDKLIYKTMSKTKAKKRLAFHIDNFYWLNIEFDVYDYSESLDELCEVFDYSYTS